MLTLAPQAWLTVARADTFPTEIRDPGCSRLDATVGNSSSSSSTEHHELVGTDTIKFCPHIREWVIGNVQTATEMSTSKVASTCCCCCCYDV